MNPTAIRERLAANLAAVRGRIDAARRAAGRTDDVCLVAVTKSAPVPVIRELVALGVRDLGESRVQQLTARAAELTPAATSTSQPALTPHWHMVGHLQRNKVRALLAASRIVHSVDSLRLAQELDSEAARAGCRVDVFLEVLTSGEPSKHGTQPAEAPSLAQGAERLTNLRLCGLMTMAPLDKPGDAARPYFAMLRELRDDLLRSGAVGPQCQGLSMGMSGDFEAATLEGATHVRIGSILFEGISTPNH